MARYLYSELASLVEARRNCAQHRYDTVSVLGGWQTRRMVDGTLVGPVFNSATNVWAWQGENLPNQGNAEWFDKHEDKILSLVKQYMPSGSGFDSGTQIDLEHSHGGKLVFTTAFHHMNEVGYYDGWTTHQVTVTPAFDGVNIRVSGRNRNDIKDYIYETFDYALRSVPSVDELVYSTEEVTK